MKNQIYTLILVLLLAACTTTKNTTRIDSPAETASPEMSSEISTETLDRSQLPAPGPAPLIQLGQPESFVLENGLKVLRFFGVFMGQLGLAG